MKHECMARLQGWAEKFIGWLKKELCHRNECIVCFQINPQWIIHSGLWKVVLETFQNGLENWWRETCLTMTMLLHTSLWLQWLLCVTGIELNLVDYPPYSPDLAPSIFCSPTWKNMLLGSSIGPMMRSYLQLRTFSRIRMRASTPRECKCCNIDGRSVWTAGKTRCKHKPHLVKFDHCIIVSLWTFQPTFISHSSNGGLHTAHMCEHEGWGWGGESADMDRWKASWGATLRTGAPGKYCFHIAVETTKRCVVIISAFSLQFPNKGTIFFTLVCLNWGWVTFEGVKIWGACWFA